jgi:hypothetical protein
LPDAPKHSNPIMTLDDDYALAVDHFQLKRSAGCRSACASKTLAAKAPPVAPPPIVSRTKIIRGVALQGLKCDFGNPVLGLKPEALFLRRIATENQDPRRSWLRFGETSDRLQKTYCVIDVCRYDVRWVGLMELLQSGRCARKVRNAVTDFCA